MNTLHSIAVACAALTVSSIASAQNIDITFENLQPAGGFSFTPFWFGVHDGGFDSYDGGSNLDAFPGTEELAELGLTGPISDAFANSAAGVNGGVQGVATDPSTSPPVFVPGDIETVSVDVGDPTTNRYFSYASMLIPTNDLFVANGDPFAHELFDAAGNFNGPITISIFGRDVNDAGTEANDILDGPAFVITEVGTEGTVTDEPVRNLFTDPLDEGYLASIVGAQTPLGEIGSSFGADTLIARITIVPTPGVSGVLLAGAGCLIRRQRKA